MVIIPGKGRVFVKLRPVEERVLKSGLIIPGKHAEQSRIGEVISVGKGVEDYKPGDLVFINFFSGTGVEYPGLEYNFDTNRFLSEVEILGTATE